MAKKSSQIRMEVMKRTYAAGVRRCPCCDVQLQWKESPLNRTSNMATVEHIVPVSMGGVSSIENMMVVCARCNHGRASRSFIKSMQKGKASSETVTAVYVEALKSSISVLIFTLITNVSGLKAGTVKTRFQTLLNELDRVTEGEALSNLVLPFARNKNGRIGLEQSVCDGGAKIAEIYKETIKALDNEPEAELS